MYPISSPLSLCPSVLTKALSCYKFSLLIAPLGGSLSLYLDLSKGLIRSNLGLLSTPPILAFVKRDVRYADRHVTFNNGIVPKTVSNYRLCIVFPRDVCF